MVKYPHITVSLSDRSRRFLDVVAHVCDALHAAKISPDEIDQFAGEAVWAGGTWCGNSKKMLEVVAQWVTVK